jgi:hypothetical protein
MAKQQERDLERWMHNAIAETYDLSDNATVTREDGTTKQVRVRRAEQLSNGTWLIGYMDKHRKVDVTVIEGGEGNPEGNM